MMLACKLTYALSGLQDVRQLWMQQSHFKPVPSGREVTFDRSCLGSVVNSNFWNLSCWRSHPQIHAAQNSWQLAEFRWTHILTNHTRKEKTKTIYILKFTTSAKGQVTSGQGFCIFRISWHQKNFFGHSADQVASGKIFGRKDAQSFWQSRKCGGTSWNEQTSWTIHIKLVWQYQQFIS